MTGFRTKRRTSKRTYCDTLFRQRIRDRDENTCQAGNGTWGVLCGPPLDVAHCIGRGRAFSVRWTDDNAALLCRNHHRWADSHELDKVEWFRSFLGEERYEALKAAARVDWDKSYDAVLERLKAKAV